MKSIKWTDKAWKTIAPIFEQTKNMNFIEEMKEGNLDKEKFLFYIYQDFLYLNEYGRILANVALKLKDLKHREAFLNFTLTIITAEKELHQNYFKELKLAEKYNISPTCMLYTSFLHKQIAVEPIEVAIAAVLPCFTIYKHIGDYVYANQNKNNNPYNDWISTYGGEDYAKSVQIAEDIVDHLAANTTEKMRTKMMDAYIKSSQMEFMFWDSAYKMEKWPI